MNLVRQLLDEGFVHGSEEYYAAYKKRYAAAHYLKRKGAPLERIKRGETRAEGNLRVKYGINKHQLEAMFVRAKCLCECCGRTVARHATGAAKADIGHIDHCHSTGKVRGILCSPCNQALGLLKDNPMLAVKYLEVVNGRT